MAIEIESHIITIKKTYNDYLIFLAESLKEVVNKSELVEYLNYVQNKNEHFNTYINKLNSENSTHLYGLINGVCRYYSEFNWFEDYDFYTKSQFFKNILSEESQYIYNYFHSENLQI
jgi:hypothetical protein